MSVSTNLTKCKSAILFRHMLLSTILIKYTCTLFILKILFTCLKLFMQQLCLTWISQWMQVLLVLILVVVQFNIVGCAVQRQHSVSSCNWKNMQCYSSAVLCSNCAVHTCLLLSLQQAERLIHGRVIYMVRRL
jgi:hypothetical protein